MPSREEISLMAHLMRRAGFGASREEVEARCAQGYEATVEELLNPQAAPVDDFDLIRYHPGAWKPGTLPPILANAPWFYHLLNTRRPLEEKMTVFWHQIFATGVSKVDHNDEINDMICLFRRHGLGDYKDLLLKVAQSPAMIFWLDNNENHKTAVNENWGRELLELFSMGVGNYTEVDVREASRAFTGWTIVPKLPRFPMGRFDWGFEYRPEDHDNTSKTFLGETGNFNGEDIIDIICQHPATAEFIARHLYNFFVADEPQVPAWAVTPPRDPAAIETLADAFIESRYDIRSTLRVLFNSQFFKQARFAKLKSPTEMVVSSLRLAGGAEFPAPGFGELTRQVAYMGQELMNPPSVEGWHTGVEWVNSGSLLRRINFAADLVGDTSRPGVKAMIGRIKSLGALAPEQAVDACLDLMGPLEVLDSSRQELLDLAKEGGDLRWDTPQAEADATRRLGELLQLVVSLREYQYE